MGEEATQWVRLVAFGDAARPLEGLTKGAKVYAEGRLKLETWVKDGAERSGLTLVAYRVEVLGQIGKRRPQQAVEPDRAEDEGVPF
jgi:single-stranded DNA-binding protein